jgi:hypothetical protein
MSDREKFLLRMAVSYLSANCDDAIEAFEAGVGQVSVGGRIEQAPTEGELHSLLEGMEPGTDEVSERFITDVVFLRELDGDDIFALFPALAACTNRTDLMVCYSRIGQHSSASYDYCNECDEVTDPDEYADLFAELQFNGYELCVIRKDRYNTFKYAANRKREAGLC